jgi:anti-sigma factor RsiW
MDTFDVNADEVTCQQFVELITDYFEGALPDRTLSQVEEHLVMCDWCVTYLEQMEFTLDALAALRSGLGSGQPRPSTLALLRAKRGGSS